MTADAWITLGIVSLMVFALVGDRIQPAVVVLGATVTLLVVDVIDEEQAFSGFGNSAPITVGALYVVAAGIERTGLLGPVVDSVLGATTGLRVALARITTSAAGVSAFLNNTPVLATLIPEVERWSTRRGRSVSKILMPLSFATILGGVVTTLGTSTNLVVSGLLEEAGEGPFSLFELSPVGLPVALAGLGSIVLLAPRLLPDRRGIRSSFEEKGGRGFEVQMRVEGGGQLDGRTVNQAGLRHLQGVFLVEITRGQERIAPVGPTTVLAGDDILTFVGNVELVIDLQRRPGLVSAEHQHLLAVDSGHHTFFEAVIGEASPLLGRTLAEAEFRARYQAAVVAIHRAGQRVEDKLGQVALRNGDTLLLLAGDDFRARWGDRRDFLLVSHLGGQPPTASRRAPLAGLIIVAVAVAAATGLLPILEASLLGAAATIALGILTPNEARQSVDLDVLVLIGASFGVGAAVNSSGLADTIANGLVDTFDLWGQRGVLLGVVLGTVLLTELVTNNAAAVLMFPIAVAAGAEVGLDAHSMAIALAVSASASFLTPIGYQTNTMVYGPGGYRFTDYFRLGFPLTAVVVVTVVTIVPWI